jgi:uncharacterized repeat protein (TIGR01451 family)
MRRISCLVLALLTIALGAIAGALTAAAASVVTVTNGVTDNYKPIWNADPTIPESRTWLQLGTVTADGVTYRPASLPVATDNVYTDSVAVVGSDGSAGTFTVAAPSDRIQLARFRTTKSGQWGPLLQLTDRTTLRDNPIPVTLALVKGGVTVATTRADYIWDQQLATVPPGHVEYNSPGGRFWFGCKPTRADWEAAAPADTCSTGTADLAVTMTSTSNVAVGNTFGYTITVTNTGSGTATNLRLTDTVPASLRTQSVVPGAGISCTGTAAITCTAASLAPGARVTLTINAAAVVPGTLTNSVTATATTSPTATVSRTASRSVLSEGFACTMTGTAAADTMTAPSSTRAVICGLGGNDRLTGAGGNDQLYGGDGNDVLIGGAGDDVLTGGPQDDTIDGGTHVTGDRVSFADARSSIVVNFGQLHAWDDAAVPGEANIGYDSLAGLEGAIGTPFGDQMLGGAAAERLEGVGGADQLWGYGGNDVLDGGVGNDTVYGNEGNDTLRGNNGNDKLVGGTGVDSLDGQADTDTCSTGGEVGDSKVNCEA